VVCLANNTESIKAMKTNPDKKPRLYADFNKWDGDGESRWLILTCKGTSDDLERLNIQLTEGLEVTFFSDDSDQAGNSDEIEADGYVHFDTNTNQWVGMIDWNAIRHASDRAKK
jgi:hypothetical protein